MQHADLSSFFASRLLAACALPICLLAGCATHSSMALAPAYPDKPWQTVQADPADGFVLAPNPSLRALPEAPVVDVAHSYTLPELIDLAQRNHPATRIAWNDARNAALAAGVARNSWLPHLTMSVLGGYQRRRSNTEQMLPLETAAHGHGAAGVLSLQWLLFDFGERNALSEAAEHGVNVANIGFTAIHQQLIEAVSLAYYAHMAARGRIKVAERTLVNSQTVLDAAQARFARGVGTRVEVAQARQGQAQAELLRVQANNALRDTQHTLMAAIGISPLSQLQLAEMPEPKLDAGMAAPLEQLIADALSRRPDVQAAHAALLASHAGLKAAEAARKPKLFLAASASRSASSTSLGTSVPSIGVQVPPLNLSGSGSGVGVFVGVTLPLLDGGTRASAALQAQQRIESAQARLDRIRQDAVQQIVVAQDALQNALATAEAAQVLQSTAAVTYDAALEAYRQGLGTISAVALADTQILQAGQALADARALAQSAAVTLALAVGTLGKAPR